MVTLDAVQADTRIISSKKTFVYGVSAYRWRSIVVAFHCV